MTVVTKRNGKILMMLGLLVTLTGFFGSVILYAMYGMASAYTVWGGLSAFFLVVIGPLLAMIGIPLFVIGAKRLPSKLMDIVQSDVHMRTRAKISFLAEQLKISEEDVKKIVSRLMSDGQPISIDGSTMEAIYNPKLLSPSAKIKKPSMTSYEKLTVVLTILGILVSIIITFLK